MSAWTWSRFRFLLGLVLVLATIATAVSAKILVPMDLEQSDHLRAYGVAYRALQRGESVEWLLNYRGGSFLLEDVPANE
ncbi:MAG: asparagine synthetase B, partial [Candidatus Eisenbacteria bacterium]|nr:asparagine synthetase B [Candidatus Eisenbacteria bacterium]